MSQSLHVVCYGNIWRGNDGFGILVTAPCQFYPFLRLSGYSRVERESLTPLPFFENTAHVLIVDALNNMGNPGKLHLLTPDCLHSDMVATSTHDFDIHSLLRLLPGVLRNLPLFQDPDPRSRSGKYCTFSESLSSPVPNAVPKTVELILNDLARMNT